MQKGEFNRKVSENSYAYFQSFPQSVVDKDVENFVEIL